MYNIVMKYNNSLRKEISNQNKNRIIESAKKLVLDKGYNNVSVSEITKEAGISKGAFYIHYESKEALIQDIIGFTFNKVKEDSSAGSLYDRISRYLIGSMKKILNEGVKTTQMWFSDTVNASLFGQKKLKYDENYIMSILLDEKNENDALIISKKITLLYYGILVAWCITDGQEDPMQLILNFINNDLKTMIEIK